LSGIYADIKRSLELLARCLIDFPNVRCMTAWVGSGQFTVQNLDPVPSVKKMANFGFLREI